MQGYLIRIAITRKCALLNKITTFDYQYEPIKLVQSKNYTEEELIGLLHKSNEEAFSVVFRDYYGALCYFAEKIVGTTNDAEDLVEEVFEKLWMKNKSFENLRHLKDFLYKSTRNACLDFIRRSSHSKERQLVFVHSQDNWQEDSASTIIRFEVFRELYREIKNLPEQCSKIISMSYIDGKKNEEIARELGLSLQTVKNHKSRGIALLRGRLSAELFGLLLLLANRF